MPVAEPNHELTDSEAQAFQPEPHLQDLLKRLQPGSAARRTLPGAGGSARPARKPSDGHEGRRPPRSSQQGLQ
jgi:hypothetical protein